jgi:hypothetical protein
MTRGSEDKIVWLYVPTETMSIEIIQHLENVPVSETLLMTPVQCTDNLWTPPSEVRLRDTTVQRT